jgi:hypothetical protein
MSRAEELIRNLVSIPDPELKKVPPPVFSMLRGMVNRFSDHDTLGEHEVCRDRLVEQGRQIEKLETELKKAKKKGN